jgi:hypothetical protein
MKITPEIRLAVRVWMETPSRTELAKQLGISTASVDRIIYQERLLMEVERANRTLHPDRIRLRPADLEKSA